LSKAKRVVSRGYVTGGQLAQMMRDYNGRPLNENKAFLKDVIDAFKQALCDGKEIRIPGFGVWDIREYPQTNMDFVRKHVKDEANIRDSYYSVKFTTGHQFRTNFKKAMDEIMSKPEE